MSEEAPEAAAAAAAVQHGPVPDNLECMVTFDDITVEDGNYAEYQTAPSMAWHPAKMSNACVSYLLNTQFEKWKERVQTTDCQAELRRLLSHGPPVWVSDENALPLPEGDTHICTLWFAEDDTERSAMLTNAVTGEERDKLWEDFKKFQIEGAADEEEAEAAEAAATAGGGDGRSEAA